MQAIVLDWMQLKLPVAEAGWSEADFDLVPPIATLLEWIVFGVSIYFALKYICTIATSHPHFELLDLFKLITAIAITVASGLLIYKI